MGKASSNAVALLGRLVKFVMVALVLPLAIGLFTALVEQLDVLSASGGSFREWASWGFVTYIGLHLLLYRPRPVFEISHRMFSAIAVWLFGGQVAPVDEASSGGASRGKGSGKKGRGGGEKGQGSTLVAFSPYVIPLYTVLACALARLLTAWFDRRFIDGPAAFLVGLTIAFHWVMTADDLQEQREQWHIETYLLAIGLVFVLTLVLAGFALPLAMPEVSFIRALADGFARAGDIYRTLVDQLFLF